MALGMPMLPGVCRCITVPGSALKHVYSKSMMLCLRHHLFWVIVGLLRMTMRLWGWQHHPGWRVKLYPRANSFGIAPRGTGGPAIQGILEGIAHRGSQLIPNMPTVHVEKTPLLPIQFHISCQMSLWGRCTSQDGRQLQGSTNPALPCFLQGFCPKEESAVPGMELASTSAQVTLRTFLAWIVYPGSR